jgi:hypothetical protein
MFSVKFFFFFLEVVNLFKFATSPIQILIILIALQSHSKCYSFKTRILKFFKKKMYGITIHNIANIRLSYGDYVWMPIFRYD